MRTSALPMHTLSPKPVPQTSIILVVTEVQAMRQTITSALREEGRVVLAVGDEAVACEIADEHPLALIVLDALSLQRHGFAIYEHLRASAVPLLLLIEEESEVALLESHAVYAEDYLRKPLSREEVLACVQARPQLSAKEDR